MKWAIKFGLIFFGVILPSLILLFGLSTYVLSGSKEKSYSAIKFGIEFECGVLLVLLGFLLLFGMGAGILWVRDYLISVFLKSKNNPNNKPPHL